MICVSAGIEIWRVRLRGQGHDLLLHDSLNRDADQHADERGEIRFRDMVPHGDSDTKRLDGVLVSPIADFPIGFAAEIAGQTPGILHVIQ